MQIGGVGYDAVKVEQDGVVLVASYHGAAFGLAYLSPTMSSIRLSKPKPASPIDPGNDCSDRCQYINLALRQTSGEIFDTAGKYAADEKYDPKRKTRCHQRRKWRS
jgi:hypothetical protein